jgi:hypothetical protein
VSFANVNGIKGKDISKIKCFNLQEMGHYANDSPSKTNIKGATMLLMEEEDSDGSRYTDYDSAGEFSFLQGGNKYVNPHWILLDSQSTA